MTKGSNSIILFDGVCNFCNYWINFLIDHDKKNCFKFAALQSEKGRELLEKFNLPIDDYDSFILISNSKVYKKSLAAFEIATPQIPTSPSLIAASASQPIKVGRSNATDSPVCP